LYITVIGQSQSVMQPQASKSQLLGAYSLKLVDVYSTRTNSASLAQLSGTAAAVYGERRFLIQELNLFTASFGLVTQSGNFGAHVSYFGSAASNQTQYTLAYGRAVTDKIDVGAGFYLQQINQGGYYGKSSAVTGSVGFLLHLTDKIHTGINVFNPIRAAYGKDKMERLPAQYSFGMGYEASEKLFVSAELVKEEDQNINVNVGFQYQPIKQLFIRAGITTQTTSYYASIGFNLKSFRLDIASNYHAQLGITPAIMLLFAFGKNVDTSVSNPPQ
jgi:hypothetical protein